MPDFDYYGELSFLLEYDKDDDWNDIGESVWTDTYTFEVKVGDVNLKQVKPAGITKLNVIWDETPGGGYYVYRAYSDAKKRLMNKAGYAAETYT